jgi:putative peptidoglycan lipid II flippase
VGLVSHSIYEILARAFYALHDTKTPVIVGVIAMSLNIAFSYLFVWVFRQRHLLPLGGLALANSLATTLEMIVLVIVMSKRLKGLEIGSLLRTTGKAAVSAGVMAVGLNFWLASAPGMNPILFTLIGAGMGAAIYFALIWLLRVPELSSLIQMVKMRVLRRK